MMRLTVCLAALFCATASPDTVGFAQDAATTVISTPQPTGETNKEAASEAQPAVQERPLHRHPALFGMLVRNNNLRRRVGLRPHRMSPALTKAAQDHANYMARTGQFSHYANLGPQGRANKYGFGG